MLHKIHKKLNLQHHRHTGRHLHHEHTSFHGLSLLLFFTGLMLLIITVVGNKTNAADLNVNAIVPGPAPTIPAEIIFPQEATILEQTAITVTGNCEIITPPHIVKLYSNAQFIGSDSCDDGTFSIATQLFEGENILVARTFSFIDEEGPPSLPVTVTVNIPVPPPEPTPPSKPETPPVPGLPLPLKITSYTKDIWFASRQTINVNFAFEGGKAQYQVKVDWGDDSNQSFVLFNPQTVNLNHVYQKDGKYQIKVSIKDNNGVTESFEITATTLPITAAGYGLKLPDIHSNVFITAFSTNTALTIWSAYGAISLSVIFIYLYSTKKLAQVLILTKSKIFTKWLHH